MVSVARSHRWISLWVIDSSSSRIDGSTGWLGVLRSSKDSWMYSRREDWYLNFMRKSVSMSDPRPEDLPKFSSSDESPTSMPSMSEPINSILPFAPILECIPMNRRIYETLHCIILLSLHSPRPLHFPYFLIQNTTISLSVTPHSSRFRIFFRAFSPLQLGIQIYSFSGSHNSKSVENIWERQECRKVRKWFSKNKKYGKTFSKIVHAKSSIKRRQHFQEKQEIRSGYTIFANLKIINSISSNIVLILILCDVDRR